ncbi:MAG: hypothetical protein JSR60_16425 [Proteobacteria bacterium]|nr:hypothetical protein [Pseudomonadota bacterium]
MADALNWQVSSEQRIADGRAADVLRQALRLRPGDSEITLRLARLLYAGDRMAEMFDLLAPLAEASDAHDEIRLMRARAALRLGRLDVAIPLLERCGDPLADGLRARGLFDAGREDDALALAERNLARDARDTESLHIAAKLLLARGDTKSVLALCLDLLARGAGHARLLSLLALSSWAEGTPHHRMLLDREALLARQPLMPGGDAALAEEILSHPRLGLSQSYKATRGDGVRIEHIQTQGGPHAQALLANIRDAVGRYVADRASRTDHPAFAIRPGAVALNAWALVLRGDGFEAYHIHPSAWISGVFYVAVPPLAAVGDAGRIGFGPVRDIAGRDMADFPSWSLLPEAGELLLFPSYFAHRTWPTASAEPRICIAFDVEPAE